MNKILYIKSSPRKERSYCVQVADMFIDSYRNLHPEDQFDTLEVFSADLPAFDGLAVLAKYKIMHGQEHSPEEAQAWKAAEAVIGQFTAADKYVLAVPMWNFGIPYRLKQYIDIIAQPGYTFSFSPEEGYKGLMVDKPLFVCYSRGGEYPPGSESEAFDLQKRYVETVFGFMGITNIHTVIVEPTLSGGPEVAKAKLAGAIELAVEKAQLF